MFQRCKLAGCPTGDSSYWNSGHRELHPGLQQIPSVPCTQLYTGQATGQHTHHTAMEQLSAHQYYGCIQGAKGHGLREQGLAGMWICHSLPPAWHSACIAAPGGFPPQQTCFPVYTGTHSLPECFGKIPFLKGWAAMTQMDQA